MEWFNECEDKWVFLGLFFVFIFGTICILKIAKNSKYFPVPGRLFPLCSEDLDASMTVQFRYCGLFLLENLIYFFM